MAFHSRRLKAARVLSASDATQALTADVENSVTSLAKDGAHLCVGLSGGVDSMVLLDVLIAIAPRHQWQVSAIHVNHQLNPHAPEWARFCRRFCRARGVPIRVVKVTVARGDSIEAAARAARYAAYRAQPVDNIVLAQHQDDQAETVLLQLLRGAGVKGLAAMPVAREDSVRPGLRLLRPLLGVTRAQIERYATARELPWVEDDSNADTTYLRNFLRQDIMPRLETRAPAYRKTLSRAAGHQAEAAQLLDALAVIDAHGGLNGGTLAVAALQKLPAARARNVLRYFLAARDVLMPDARRLDEALRQVLTAKEDARVCIALGAPGAQVLRRHAGVLHVVTTAPPVPAGFSRSWRDERRLNVPELHAALEMRRRRGAGIALELLLAKPVTLRLRRGGEKLQPDAARPRRAVKDLLQEQGVPPWRRERLPFLWSGNRLVWVAGLGVDCAFQARPGAPGVAPAWIEQAT